MKITHLLVASLAFAVMSATQSMASNNWYVSKTGNDTAAGTEAAPFLTIQHAINISSSGDNINVGAGTYEENVVAPGHTLQFYGAVAPNAPTTELGVSVTANTTIFAQGGTVVSTAGSNNINLTFDNFTFKGGTGTQEPNGKFGGGFWVTGTCSVSLFNCMIISNSADNGGGMYVDTGSGVGLQQCIIAGCGAPYGSAIDSYQNVASNVVLNDVAICGNTGAAQQINGPYSAIGKGPHISTACDKADVNEDGIVDADDVNQVKDAAGVCLHDVNNNGVTDIDDLLLVIEGWGNICSP